MAVSGGGTKKVSALSCRYNLLGSIDANTGSPDLGWDTDQFPMDIKNCTMVMKVPVSLSLCVSVCLSVCLSLSVSVCVCVLLNLFPSFGVTDRLSGFSGLLQTSIRRRPGSEESTNKGFN